MSGTIRTQTYLLNNEFQAGQPNYSIGSSSMRDFIASSGAGTTRNVRTITSSGSMQTSDGIIFCNQSAALALTLISSPVTGQCVTVKDYSGTAATNNITISPSSGTIDGASSFVMNNNYASVDLVYNGSNWNVI